MVWPCQRDVDNHIKKLCHYFAIGCSITFVNFSSSFVEKKCMLFNGHA